MCENLPYASLGGDELEYVIAKMARLADRIENALEKGRDIA